MAHRRRDEAISYRAAPLRARAGGPTSLDLDGRSVEVVAATELPVRMWDWEHGEIDEVLLTKGAVLPGQGQLPLLDTHSRYSTEDVIGSARNLRREGGELLATAVFTSAERGQDILTKIAEGHITDVSIGYRVSDATVVPKGEKAVIGGRTWEGPVKVVTSWVPKELSVVPIGADEAAKVRSAPGGDRISVQLDGERAPEPNEESDMELDKRMEALEGAVGKIAEAVGKLAERDAKGRQVEDTEAEVERLRQEKIRQGELTVQKERARLAEIDRMCERFDIDDDFRAQLIQDGTTVDKARELLMEKIAARRTEDPGLGVPIGVTKDERDKTRAAAADGLQLRAGIALDKVQDPHSEYQHLSLFELAKARLATFNQTTRGLDKMQIFERALSHSDFDNILADVANKALLEGFEKAEETYAAWADTSGRVNDFKPHVFARASEAPSLVEVNPDGGEYKYGSMSDSKETVTAVDYGIIVPFTRKAMINDDLGALSDVREKLGAAAARKYGDLVYAVLTGTHTMGDGNALWDADNHANYTASGAAPSVTGLNTGAKSMATQKDTAGVQNLNIRPQFLLSPWALKGAVDNLLTSTSPTAPGSAASPVLNPWAYLVPVYEARLDAASATAWYLAARRGMTVKLFTLNGQMTPVLESKAGWVTDGMEFKCRVTAAAKAMDWRGLYKNAGA